MLELLRQFYKRLRLRINETKSAVDLAWKRSFLGYSLWVAPGRVIKRKVVRKALTPVRARMPGGVGGVPEENARGPYPDLLAT